MQCKTILALALSGVALAQNSLPGNTTGLVPTIEGALSYDGVVNASFVPAMLASISNGNPIGTTYVANFLPTASVPVEGLIGTVAGSVTAVSMNGTGDMFTVNVTGLPDVATYGPFGMLRLPDSFLV